MTNKEKLQEIFPNMIFTGTVMMYKPTEQVLASRINYSWLNAEYEEPTTKECQAESDKFDAAFQDGYNNGYAQARFDYGQEPTTKNDLGVDCISREQAIQTIQRYGVGCFDANEFSPEECERFVISKLNELPSITPQEPFINKPCVSSGTCEHDKNVVLDKIRVELIQSIQNGTLKIESGNEVLFNIIDKYQAESEE